MSRGGLEPKVIVIDDTYGFEKEARIYSKYIPALRSERSGLKAMFDIDSSIYKDGVLYMSTDITESDDSDDNSKIDFYNTPYRIRKLTPKECWRLMGFTDSDFENARVALNNEHYKGKDRSSSQLYKQAGNSIVVDVLYYIFKELYIAMPYLFDDLKVSSYFSGIGAFESALDRLYKNDVDKNSQKQLSNSLLSKNDNEAIGVASRGRYNESKEVEQHYETKKENIAYCVTTIQKDSMVMEKANKQ